MTKYYPGEVAVIMHKENPLILRAKKAKAEGPDAIEAFKEEVLQEMIEDMKADARRMVHEHILKEGSR